jgi:hypothetical protein
MRYGLSMWCLFLVWAVAFSMLGCGREPLPNAVVTQDDHLNVVKLTKGNPMVVIRVKAAADQTLPDLKSNDDYEVAYVVKTVIEDKNGRWLRTTPGIETYLKVKRNCVVQFTYKDDKGSPRVLYVKIEPKGNQG